jgi:hypothetical protein
MLYLMMRCKKIEMNMLVHYNTKHSCIMDIVPSISVLMDSATSAEKKAPSLEEENHQLKEEIAQLKQLLEKNGSKVSVMDAVGCVLHKGRPPGLHECSTCREKKDSSHFNYYNQRIDQHGYLMRSNALCKTCGDESSKERKKTLEKANKEGKIPPKPEPGDICPNCNRNWGSIETPRNWHRDHDAIKNEFRRWLCGDCNMAQHDHRHGTS